MIKPGFVYILRSQKNKRFYIGSTNDLNRRIKDHREGKSKYTRNIRPLILVFCKKFENLRTARKIEYKLKKLARRDIIEKIIQEKEIRMGL